jgi:hypothetical protein
MAKEEKKTLKVTGKNQQAKIIQWVQVPRR